MAPRTRLQTRSEQEDSSSQSEDDSNDVGFDETAGTIVFPSKLTYTLSGLDEDTQDHIIDIMDDPLPQLVLQQCQTREQDMVFQLSELKEYNIVTGNAESPFAVPKCSCEEQPTCRHILWLFDQIAKQILVDEGKPFALNEDGYSDQLGNPFESIQEFHPDVLAESLHSQVLVPSGSPKHKMPDPRRVQETREILSSLDDTPVDEYRPDLFNDPKGGKKVVKRRDLECTIFRMLLRNNEFFHYFLSSMPKDELVNNAFRRLQQRADTVLAGLDAASAPALGQQLGEHPKDVQWCANHLRRVEQQVNSIIQHTKRPLAEWELRSAAHTLIHILAGVVSRNQDVPPLDTPKTERNLYFNLIGDKDHDFVVGTLSQIPPGAISPFVGNIEQVLKAIGKHGAAVSYVDKLQRLAKQSRTSGASGLGMSSSAASGSKRSQGGGQDRKAKRMK